MGAGTAGAAGHAGPRRGARADPQSNWRNKMTERVYLFKAFERFWHWTQAALIIFMLLTGFEVHGSYTLLGFERAVNFHTIAAWSLVGLWVFAIFWHFTTGEWRQYKIGRASCR